MSFASRSDDDRQPRLPGRRDDRSGVAVAALLVNAFLWGISWWPFRAVQDHGLHSLWATALVYALVSVLIVAWRRSAPGQVLHTRSLWLLVLASGLTNACFNWAVTIGDVVRVVLLFYLMPMWAVLLARVLLHEPLRPIAMLRIAIALAGAAIVLRPPGAAWPVPGGLPDWLALAGGASFALTNVLLRREAGRPESARALAMFGGGMLVAGLLALVLTLAGPVPAPAWPPAPWVPGVLLLAAMFLVGNLALQLGAARLPANVTAVVMLSEVVFASGSAALLGQGVLTGRTLVGGSLILLSALLAARGNR